MAPRRPRRSAHAAHTGSARGTPSPRRNHGFAPRLQSGADAEAILSEAPVPAAEHKVGCTGLLSRAGPRAPRAPAETVTSPAYPTPARVSWRPQCRRALPVSGSAVTRGALAPPRATSPLPRRATLFRPNKGASGCRRARLVRTRRARLQGQGRRRRSQSGFCAAPPGPLRGRNLPRPPRRPGRTAPAAPGSAGTRKPVPSAANRSPQSPASASPQSAVTGRLQSRSPVPSCLGPIRTSPGRRGADAGL